MQSASSSRSLKGKKYKSVRKVKWIKRKKSKSPSPSLKFDSNVFFDLCPYGLVLARMSDMKFLHVNQVFADMLGYNCETLYVKSYLDFVHPEDRQKTVLASGDLLHGMPVIHFRNRYIHADGRVVYIDWSALQDMDSGLVYAVATDISKMLLDQQRLQHAEQRAAEENFRAHFEEKLAAERERVLIKLSHECKNALAGIVLSLDLLKSIFLSHCKANDISPDFLLESFKQVYQCADEQKRLFTDILNPLVQTEDFNLSQLIKDVLISRFGNRNDTNQLNVNYSDEDVWIRGNADAVRTIIVNLISNSLKNTVKGTVELDFRADSEGVTLSVKDTGKGLSPQDKSKMFTRRYSNSIRGESSGFGLCILHDEIDKYQGTIDIQSKLGTGTTFIVTLPFPSVEPNQPIVADAMTVPKGVSHKDYIKGKRILIVDDSDVNRRILKRLLSLVGAQVFEAENGKKGVDFYMTQLTAIDLIIMDLSMPEMDGFEATREIRQLEKKAGDKKTLIVSITANENPTEIAKAKESGVDDVYIKGEAVKIYLQKFNALFHQKESGCKGSVSNHSSAVTVNEPYDSTRKRSSSGERFFAENDLSERARAEAIIHLKKGHDQAAMALLQKLCEENWADLQEELDNSVRNRSAVLINK